MGAAPSLPEVAGRRRVPSEIRIQVPLGPPFVGRVRSRGVDFPAAPLRLRVGQALRAACATAEQRRWRRRETCLPAVSDPAWLHSALRGRRSEVGLRNRSRARRYEPR